MPALEVPAASLLVDGEWTPARNKGELAVVDPATREPIRSTRRSFNPTGQPWCHDDPVMRARSALSSGLAENVNPCNSSAITAIGSTSSSSQV